MIQTTTSTTTTSSSSVIVNDIDVVSFGWTPLPLTFQPGNLDIVVGTGREAKNHPGNKLFMEKLKSYIPRYSLHSNNKLEKSLIISEIVSTIQDEAGGEGGFVKKSTTSKKWYIVNDKEAREKVSQGMRNLLSSKYRSSQAEKKRRRGQLCRLMQQNVDEMMNSPDIYCNLSERMTVLKSQLNNLKQQSSSSSSSQENDVENLFTRTNLEILESLKMSVQQQQQQQQTTTTEQRPIIVHSQ